MAEPWTDGLDEEDGEEEKKVSDARAALKNRFNKGPASGTKKPSTNTSAAPASNEGKEMRSWV